LRGSIRASLARSLRRQTGTPRGKFRAGGCDEPRPAKSFYSGPAALCCGSRRRPRPRLTLRASRAPGRVRPRPFLLQSGLLPLRPYGCTRCAVPAASKKARRDSSDIRALSHVLWLAPTRDLPGRSFPCARAGSSSAKKEPDRPATRPEAEEECSTSTTRHVPLYRTGISERLSGQAKSRVGGGNSDPAASGNMGILKTASEPAREREYSRVRFLCI